MSLVFSAQLPICAVIYPVSSAGKTCLAEDDAEEAFVCEAVEILHGGQTECQRCDMR